MKCYTDLVSECREHVEEIFPWDLVEELKQNSALILIDVSEPTMNE